MWKNPCLPWRATGLPEGEGEGEVNQERAKHVYGLPVSLRQLGVVDRCLERHNGRHTKRRRWAEAGWLLLVNSCGAVGRRCVLHTVFGDRRAYFGRRHRFRVLYDDDWSIWYKCRPMCVLAISRNFLSSTLSVSCNKYDVIDVCHWSYSVAADFQGWHSQFTNYSV